MILNTELKLILFVSYELSFDLKCKCKPVSFFFFVVFFFLFYLWKKVFQSRTTMKPFKSQI